MVAEAQSCDLSFERCAVGFAVAISDIRVGRAEDHIRSGRNCRHDGRHGRDCRFEAFARPHQTEAQDHSLTVQAETRFHSVGGDYREVGHAVWDH